MPIGGGREEQRLDILFVLSSGGLVRLGPSLCNRRQTQRRLLKHPGPLICPLHRAIESSTWAVINSGLTLHLHPYKFSGGCFGSPQRPTPLLAEVSGLYLTLNCNISWLSPLSPLFLSLLPCFSPL